MKAWGNGMQMISFSLHASWDCYWLALMCGLFPYSFHWLHLGWNITQNYIFPVLKQVPYILCCRHTRQLWPPFILPFYHALCFPKFRAACDYFIIVKTHRPVAMPWLAPGSNFTPLFMKPIIFTVLFYGLSVLFYSCKTKNLDMAYSGMIGQFIWYRGLKNAIVWRFCKETTYS